MSKPPTHWTFFKLMIIGLLICENSLLKKECQFYVINKLLTLYNYAINVKYNFLCIMLGKCIFYYS